MLSATDLRNHVYVCVEPTPKTVPASSAALHPLGTAELTGAEETPVSARRQAGGAK